VIGRPEPTEHSPYYAKYIALVPGEDILKAFEAETAATRALLQAITPEKSLERYDPVKWSIRQAWLHVVDCERVFAYRVLRFARADKAPLPGFDSDDWVGPAAADSRPWPSILQEYDDVRRATLTLLRGLPEDAWLRTGSADGNPASVRALAHIILGHDIHHRTVLRERYL
jgi:uncharacterized damage-inducible protein DinB